MDKDTPFFMMRNNINQELISQGGAEKQVIAPAKYAPGTDDDDDHFQLHAVSNFSIDNSFTTIMTHPDKRKTVEIVLNWDDQAGVSDYEIWVGRTLQTGEN